MFGEGPPFCHENARITPKSFSLTSNLIKTRFLCAILTKTYAKFLCFNGEKFKKLLEKSGKIVYNKSKVQVFEPGTKIEQGV